MKVLFPFLLGRRAFFLACACVGFFVVIGCGPDPVLPNVYDTIQPPKDTEPPPPKDTTELPETSGDDTITECELDANGLMPTYCPCTENIECASGYCIQSPQGKVCTDTCIADCPDGWACELVGGLGPDTLLLCVPKHLYLCRPCGSDEDCKSPFADKNERCVHYGDGGSFCGISCAPEAGTDQCPEGYQCNSMATLDGGPSFQCVATDETCPCSLLAVREQAKTTCLATTETGTCPGLLQCVAEGINACEQAPLPEICDGIDNDCDGFEDEVCTPILRGHLMGDGFSLSSDNGQFFLHQTLGAPRMAGTSQNDTFVLTPGFPHGGN